MPRVTDPPTGGQETDPPEPRTRCSALRLTAAEARAVKTAIRKVAATRRNGYIALAVKLGIPPATLYHAMSPKGRPSPGLAIRFAAVVGVPVEVLLGGKVVVAPAIVGVAA
jgi:hypothetical protein